MYLQVLCVYEYTLTEMPGIETEDMPQNFISDK